MNPYQHSFDGNIPQDVAGKQGENVIFIVYTLKDSPETLDKVKDVCANFSALIRSMRNRFPDMMFSCTMGFGADAWNRLFPEQGKPKELKTFEEIKGEKHTAVSTPGDLLFHIRAKQMGLCFEFASIIDEKLQGVVEPVDETHGFRYMDGKAIIGFVDGTENPAVDENPYHFAVVGEEDADFAGGSYVFVQKYYLKVKIFELLLYLDALELAGTKEERPYFYKTQVEKIKAIRSLMTENLTEHYTLDDLAKRFDIPHTTMKSCFKSIYGNSIFAYMREYRMNYAANLLREQNDLSIAQIAGMVGYDSPGKFSSAFKAVMGSTPLSYRKFPVHAVNLWPGGEDETSK